MQLKSRLKILMIRVLPKIATLYSSHKKSNVLRIVQHIFETQLST